jgi:hypothetical protein
MLIFCLESTSANDYTYHEIGNAVVLAGGGLLEYRSDKIWKILLCSWA